MKWYTNILLFTACMLYHIECRAQHNVYDIHDDLYEYYLLLDAHIQSPKALSMADTLFDRAQRERDVKAQCMALYCKSAHYYVVKDLQAQISTFHKYAPFIKRTPYLQYYFGMWGNIIVSHINNGDYVKARTEIANQHKEAVRLNSNFGIVQSHTLQANIYYHSGYYRLALTYYTYANNLVHSKNAIKGYDMNIQLARCCFYLCRWKECKDYLTELLNNPITRNNAATRIYALCLSYECNQIPLNPAKVKAAYKQLMASQQVSPMLNDELFLLDEALYYYNKYYKKDNKTATKYLNGTFAVPDYIDDMHRARDFEAAGDYRKAALSYDQYIKHVDQMNFKEEQYLIDEFVPQLDVDNLEHEKIELRKNNNALKLGALNKSQRILALTEQQTQGRLLIRQREQQVLMNSLATQSASIDQQTRLLKINKLQTEQKRSETALAKKKDQWQLSWFLILLGAVLSIVTFYALEKRMKRKHLREEKKKADKSNYMKSLFFQNMNHEIRTPLNAIGGFNQLLNGEMSASITSEEKKQMVKMIAINNELLTTLVNDVIDLSNFESGTYQIHLKDVDVNSVCTTVVESIRGRENKGVQLCFKPGRPNGFSLQTDAQRLQQILSNYLTNSCKHTESGSIVLSYEVLDRFVRFFVTDTGCGVSDEDADKVFQRFLMVDNNRRGTGLGLHICTLIAKLLHGKVYLDKTYKMGARFVFDHPLVMALLMTIVMACTPWHVMAKNEFGIHDEVYQLYVQMEEVSNPVKGMAMANKMYALAVKKKDVKGQCYALYMQFCYLLIEGDTKASRIKFEECKRRCLATHNYGVLADCWLELIRNLLQRDEHEQAKSELGKFYDITRKYDYEAMISAYYCSAANYYFVQNQYAAAIYYYLQSLRRKDGDANTLNYMAGQCFFMIGNYHEAVKHCEAALIYSKLDAYASLSILEKSYCKLGRFADATRIYKLLLKCDMRGYPLQAVRLRLSALYEYYKFSGNKAKADQVQAQIFEGNHDGQEDRGEYYLNLGKDKLACKSYKQGAKIRTQWLASNYTNINEFYAGSYKYRDAEREKELLQLNAMNLSLKQKQDNHHLLLLKHEQTMSMLHANELAAKEKEGKLELQRILLDQKKAECKRQAVLKHGLMHRQDIRESMRRWQTGTIITVAIFILFGIYLFVKRLRRTERKLKLDAERAKKAEQRKSEFYERIREQIREPLDTIIRLNHKLNDNDDVMVSAAERLADVSVLNAKTAFITTYINDILVVSKLESGTYVADKTACRPDQICAEIVATLNTSLNSSPSSSQRSSQDTPHRLECHDDSPNGMPPSILSDSKMLSEMASSFLRYAADNDHSESPIVLTTGTHHHTLTMAVSYRDGTIPDRTALGLCKCRMIAELLHGKLSVDTLHLPIVTLSVSIPIELDTEEGIGKVQTPDNVSL